MVAPIWRGSERPAARIAWPMVGWAFITSRSVASNRPGLQRTRSGMPTLPRSCIGEAWKMASRKSLSMPSAVASSLV